MRSPLIPVSLFSALVLGVAAAVPLSVAGSALALLSVAVLIGAMGGLAWFVLRADREADPRLALARTAASFDERWAAFERDFWAHVSAGDGARD